MAKPDKNGLYNPGAHPDGLEAYTNNPPKSVSEAVKRGYNQYIDSNGVEQKMRYKTRAKVRNGARYEVEPLQTRDANRGSDARRAATNQQSLTLEDYQDFARRNGYTQEEAAKYYKQNQDRLKDVRKIVTQSKGGKNYEHLLPTRSPLRGGVEHWRTIIPMDSDLNAGKSDKLASIPAAQQAGVPLTKSGALQADFANKDQIPWEQQQKIILDDINAQGSDVKTTRQVRQDLNKNPNVVQDGEKFKLSLKPEAPQITELRMRNLRKIAGTAAGAGVLGLGFLGTGASAMETDARRQIAQETGDVADKIQAGISGISLAADVASYTPIGAIPGTIISTGADVVNMTIDMFRQGATHQRIRGRSGAQKALQGG